MASRWAASWGSEAAREPEVKGTGEERRGVRVSPVMVMGSAKAVGVDVKEENAEWREGETVR